MEELIGSLKDCDIRLSHEIACFEQVPLTQLDDFLKRQVVFLLRVASDRIKEASRIATDKSLDVTSG